MKGKRPGYKAALGLARLRIRQDQGLVKGCRPFLRLARNGPAPFSVLFLHGFSASPFEGLALADFLGKQGFNVYGPRLAGHGQGRLQFDQATWKDWLASAREGLDIALGLGRRTVILGHSGGGVLGTLLAQAHPEQVKALVLAAPAFSFMNPLAKWTVLAPVRWLAPSMVYKSDDSEITRHWQMDYATSAVAELVRAGKRGQKALTKLNLPLAMIQSSADSIISTRDNQRRFTRIPSQNKRYFTYPTTEHNVIYKANPFQRQVFGWIKSFLDEVSSEC